MNKYLIKIAEMKSKPYRDRVEVLIRKGDLYLVTENKNPDTKETWAGFPGGGTDSLTEKEACMNECLEEVGISVKNLKNLGLTYKQEGGLSKKQGRDLKYRGSITKWYVADYDSMNRSKLGDDGDSRRYSWQTYEEALRGFKSGRGMGEYRAKALKASRAL